MGKRLSPVAGVIRLMAFLCTLRLLAADVTVSSGVVPTLGDWLATSPTVDIGTATISPGAVHITAPTEVTVHDNIHLNSRGPGMLTIGSSATVTVLDRFFNNNLAQEKGTLLLEGGILRTGTFQCDSADVQGTGSIETSGLIGDDYPALIFDHSSDATLHLTGDGRDILLHVTADGTGGLGPRETIARHGAVLATSFLVLGGIGAPHASALVTGEGTSWVNERATEIGTRGQGSLRVEDGAYFETSDLVGASISPTATCELVLSGEGTECRVSGSFEPAVMGTSRILIQDGALLDTPGTFYSNHLSTEATITVAGAGAVWKANSITLGASNDGTTQKYHRFILNVAGRAKVEADLVILKPSSSGSHTLNLWVSEDFMLQGSFLNDGQVNVMAGGGLPAGDYQPIQADELDGEGNYAFFGGTWDRPIISVRPHVLAPYYIFTASPILPADGGVTGQVLDAARLGFNGNSLVASFPSGLTETNDFQATPVSVSSIGQRAVIAAYDVATTVTDPIHLSVYAGTGCNREFIRFWRRANAASPWVSFVPAYSSYDGNWINFIMDTPGGYAVTAASPPASTFAQWQAGITWNGADSSPQANPDRDALSNLEEYALGSDPLADSSAAAPTSASIREGDNTYLALTFRRNIDAGDAAYYLEYSEDLVNWVTYAYGNSSTVITPLDDQTDLVTVRRLVSGEARMFVRLRIAN